MVNGLKSDREIVVKCLLISAALAIFLSLFVPYWRLHVVAPQYPKGLSLAIYLNRVEGDVREIDGLNHYIGMRPLAEAAEWERKLAAPGLAMAALCLLLTSFFCEKRRFLWLVVPALVLPLVFAADLYWWLRSFGLNLDPKAPLSSSIQPFVPPLLGYGKIAQFKAVAYFSLGFYLSVLADVLIAVGLFLRFRKQKKSSQGHTIAVYAAGMAIVFFLFLNPAEARTLEVAPQGGPHPTIQSALQAASDGDTIMVKSGFYQGPIVVDKSVRLVGKDFPVVDGGGRGTIVQITAARVAIDGFIFQNTGDRLNQEDAAVLVTAPEARIEGNQFRDVLFGIYLRRAPDAVIRNNVLSGKTLPLPRRGDLIRVWYSDHVLIEDNRTQRGRDVVLWFSRDLAVKGNHFDQGRYGLHFMYCHEAQVEGNLMTGNSVGAYLMYSSHLRLSYNRVFDNRGPSGYGIGFKDMDQASILENVLGNNRVGLFFDNSVGVYGKNLIAYNDIGIQLLPSSQNNQFKDNSFVDNGEQVSIDGFREHSSNDWNGNFWSDYRGFDRDQDGVGDEPYRAIQFFERLTDQYPAFKVFFSSPAAQALDFASNLFPIFAPKSKFEDQTPLMKPLIPKAEERVHHFSWAWLFVSGILLVPPGLSMKRFGKRASIGSHPGGADPAPGRSSFVTEKQVRKTVIRAERLSKRYKTLKALEDVNFQVKRGEAVALWGPNGAGKSTLLKSLLGVIPFEGKADVLSFDVSRFGREVRRNIGYLPQEIRFHSDQTALETISFYARLRGVPLRDAERLLDEWGLGAAKEVRVQALSGGMKQKLGLAVALLSDPPILLMDEPTSNLDVNTRREFHTLLLRLKEAGKTLMFCSHRVSDITGLADRVVILNTGRKIAEGTPDEVQKYLSGRALLSLTVREEDCERASRLIAEEGFQVQRNHHEIWVEVPAGRKSEPFKILLQAGLSVLDFELGNDFEESFRDVEGKKP